MMKKMLSKCVCVLALLANMQIACASEVSESTLSVTTGNQTQQWSSSQLLSNPATRVISIASDVAYQRTMQYKAIPFSTLVKATPSIASYQFVALDGFVANIPAALLQGEGQAYIAIEERTQTWPPLKQSKPETAGPFYLVWLSPEKAGVTSEQWPYQIAKIVEAAPLPERFPQIKPKGKASEAVSRGLEVYVTNCSVCHQLNGGGDAAVGPDLNLPHNPTEYFREKYLRQLIRNPAAVRSWKQSVMPGFNVSTITDKNLDDLIQYLKHMAKQRK